MVLNTIMSISITIDVSLLANYMYPLTYVEKRLMKNFLFLFLLFIVSIQSSIAQVVVYSQDGESITLDPTYGDYIIQYLKPDSTTGIGYYLPGNRVMFNSVTTVIPDVSQSGLYSYSYELFNDAASLHALSYFAVETSRTVSPGSPDEYWFFGFNPVISSYEWNDINYDSLGISPGSNEGGFSFKSVGLPAIATAYASNYSTTYFPEEEFDPPATGALDFVALMKDSTKYVIGSVVAPREDFLSLDLFTFLDTLDAFPQRSFDLGWITTSSLSGSLESSFQNVLANLQLNDEVAAVTELVSILDTVESEKDTGLTSEAYALLKFNIEYLLTQIRSYTEQPLADGWQLAGLPLDVAEPTFDSVYTSTPLTQPPIWWDGTRYVLENEMVFGHGYWAETDTSGIQPIIGTPLDTLDLSLSQGWHLFSGPSCNIAVAAISDPGGIVATGTLYGFDNGYVAADSIRQGEGYWVMTNSAGQITLDCSSTGAGKAGIPSLVFRPNATGSFAEINIRDANQGRQTLYLRGTLPAISNVSFSLPPVPPEGFFDARFDDGSRLVEGAEGIVQLQVSQYPVTVELSGNAQNTVIEELVNGQVVATRTIGSGQSIEITNTAVTAFRVRTQ